MLQNQANVSNIISPQANDTTESLLRNFSFNISHQVWNQNASFQYMLALKVENEIKMDGW